MLFGLQGAGGVDRSEAARAVEAAGYDFLGASYTQAVAPDPYCVLTEYALATKRLELGPFVTNVSTRLPVVTANAIATLDALSHGRAFLAIGTDRVTPTELDIAEVRGARELYDFCAIHQTPALGAKRQHLHFGIVTPWNITTGWHTYWLRYPGDGTVTFGVDMLVCGTSPVENVGPIGLDFAAKSADPLRFGWAGLGGPVLEPSVQYRVDWVQVTQP